MLREISWDEKYGTKIKGHWVSFKFIKEKFPYTYRYNNPYAFGDKTHKPKPRIYKLLKQQYGRCDWMLSNDGIRFKNEFDLLLFKLLIENGNYGISSNTA